LVAKVVVASVTPNPEEMYSPHQLGVGILGGAEAGAHTARRYWGSEPDGPRAFLRVNFRNAFNEIYRDKMLAEVTTHLPFCHHFISLTHSPSHLCSQAKLVLSQRGV